MSAEALERLRERVKGARSPIFIIREIEALFAALETERAKVAALERENADLRACPRMRPGDEAAFRHARECLSKAERERDEARKREAALEESLRAVGEFAAGHHREQAEHYWLHALTVDIPAMCETALEGSRGA